jgi:prolyl oligopeptidase
VSEIANYHQKLTFKPIFDEWVANWSFLKNEGTKWYYLTNYKNPYYRVIALDIEYPQEENWREVVAGDQNTIIEEVHFVYGN